MRYSLKELSRIFKTQAPDRVWADRVVEVVETDSRHVLDPAKTIFFAFKGTRTHGAHFIPQLAEKGVKVFVVDKDYKDESDHLYFFKVDNVLYALQRLAGHHRRRFQIPVIGITGSNGKTIVKEWLAHIFEKKYRVCKNPKSYNSQLGVALSVLELNETHQIAIFEAGISRLGEMAALQQMILPNYGLITNIGDAHQSGFLDIEEKTEEKLRLFESCEKIFYCKDYSKIDARLAGVTGAHAWSAYQEAEMQLEERKVLAIGSHIRLNFRNSQYSFKLPFNDLASIENTIHCIFCALHFGIEPSVIQESLSELTGLPMRMEQKEGINGCLLVNDSYSLDLKSLQLALQFVDQQNHDLSRSIIISDLVHHDAEEVYKDAAFLLSAYRFKKIIGVGDKITKLRPYLGEDQKFYYFHNTDQLLNGLDSLFFSNELILIKAARQYRLEKVFNELSLSNHDTILEIDLKAISSNLNFYRQRLNPECKVMAVVKAAAYGSGHYEVARLLEHKRIDYLAVAYPDEGILLREKGIHTPIMVMNAGTANFNDLRDYTLEPEIFSINQCIRLVKELGKQTPFNVHIKLDTGMHRLGFQQEELDALIDWLTVYKNIKVKSVFTHLSAADQSEHKNFTLNQVKLFDRMYATISQAIKYQPMRHILNSGGIAAHPEFQYDMVRIGIGLYGIDHHLGHMLEKAHHLKTRIAQIKKIRAGETVSYNRSAKVTRDTDIAILSIGYADGLPRNAGINGYKVYCRDRFIPIIGLVCMDMCMADITDIPDLYEGMEVEVFGKKAAIEQLAKVSNTIPYEILTGISSRVKRVFLQD